MFVPLAFTLPVGQSLKEKTYNLLDPRGCDNLAEARRRQYQSTGVNKNELEPVAPRARAVCEVDKDGRSIILTNGT